MNMTVVPQVGAYSVKNTRKMRRPSHSFHLRHRPFTIQPFCIAPVLPGETLKNALLQSRAVTDPIKNPLVGWWLEHHLFYVKLSQLANASTYKTMILDFSATVTGAEDGTADAKCYHYSGLNFTRECLDVVVDHYFRSEGEITDIVTIDGIPVCKVWGDTWLNSVISDDDVDETKHTATYAPIDVAELDTQYQTFLTLQAHGLQDMTYDEYLKMHGVAREEEKSLKPELLRFSRNWQYPSNTVDPTDGSAASAVSWAITERVDKDRYFTEPGFVFGVTIARPKVYLGNQRESAVHMMRELMTWLPNMLDGRPETSMRQVDAATGPLGGIFTSTSGTGSTPEEYWVDIRDLFLYGDQFVNFTMNDESASQVPLPTNATTWSLYPTETMVEGLFIDEDGVSGLDKCRQDGVINFTIASRSTVATDHTPR